MPPETRGQKRFPPDDPREWLNRARSNLTRAQIGEEIAGVYLEDLCFDAQQAAEKAIKALLIERRIEFPYIHDLAELIKLVEKSGHQVPDFVWEAARITQYAVATRYPGALDPVMYDDYDEAVAIAETVVRWAEGIIEMGT